VVSVLPVPDGGAALVTTVGMRSWGLAQGLLRHGHDVSVAFLCDDPGEPLVVDGLSVSPLRHHPDWREVLVGFDAVVVLYCSDAAHEITGLARPDLLVVLDVYFLWTVETAALLSPDLRRDYGPFLDEVERWNEVLKRGDVFLCAGESQRHYYVGALSALGVVNPFTYDRLKLLEVPFGLDDRDAAKSSTLPDPYRALGIEEPAFVMLWFGAIYPWFDIDPVLEAVLTLVADDPDVHFVVVGGRNPWVSDELYGRGLPHARGALAPHAGTQVHFVDWVPYHDRFQWYVHADVIVSLNKPGLENDYSCRTRVADYVSAQRPLITNGGDALSDRVLAVGGGFPTNGDARDLIDVVLALQQEPALTETASAALAALRTEWSWASTTRELSDVLATGDAPWAAEDAFVRAHHGPRRWSRPQGVEAALLDLAHVMRRVREEGVAGTTTVLRDRMSPRVAHLRGTWGRRAGAFHTGSEVP